MKMKKENMDKVDVKKDDELDTDETKNKVVAAESEDDMDDSETKKDDEVVDAPKDEKEEPKKESKKKMSKESVDMIFDGQADLSEDFKLKVETLFEAAVKEQVDAQVSEITESLTTQFDEKYADLEKTLNTQVDDYLNYVVTEWSEENKLAIEAGLKQEIAENFLQDLKDLFEKHNITIPDAKIDLYDKAQAEIAELKEAVNKLTESAIAKEAEILEFNKEKIISECSKGLADTQVEKLKTLVEDVECADLETFKVKVGIIKESFFKEEISDLTEETKDVDSTEDKDNSISRYIAHAKSMKDED
jgi:hypothetical protein